jgi:hypothetical protein
MAQRSLTRVMNLMGVKLLTAAMRTLLPELIRGSAAGDRLDRASVQLAQQRRLIGRTADEAGIAATYHWFQEQSSVHG